VQALAPCRIASSSSTSLLLLLSVGVGAAAISLDARGTSPHLAARLRGSAAAAESAQGVGSMTRVAESDAVTLEVDGGVGVASFQDIQVPVNRMAEARADGSTAGQENAVHTGFPLYGGLALRKAAGGWRFDVLSFDALTVRSASGPAETQASSYSRLSLATGAGYDLALFGLDVTPAVQLGGRRSSFGNGSAAHYFQGVTAGALLAVASAASWAVTASLMTAPNAVFGYSPAPILGGDPLEHSTATMSELGVASSWHLKDALWLDLGVAQERADVTIEDISAYEGFGLHVTPEDRSSRRYDLATTVLRLGVRKHF
jgi:hypothetical protein